MKLAFNINKLFITNSKSLHFINKRKYLLKPSLEGKESHMVKQNKKQFNLWHSYHYDGYDFSWEFRDRGQLPGLSSKFEFKKRIEK